MNIKILTPEFVVFDGEVDSVLLPGKNGDFHIMKNHAIVSSLVNGKSKFSKMKFRMKILQNSLPKQKRTVFFLFHQQ